MRGGHSTCTLVNRGQFVHEDVPHPSSVSTTFLLWAICLPLVRSQVITGATVLPDHCWVGAQ